MTVQQLMQGSRKSLSTRPNIGKIDIGIRLTSETMDVHTVIDMAVVCKSRTKGIYTIWYGNPSEEKGFIHDETSHCKGSSWDDDDLRVSIDFSKIPSDIEKMSIITSVLWGKELKNHFGMISQGHMRIYSHEENCDILEQNINWFNHREKTGLIWAEIYPYKDSWKVKGVEESISSKDLGELARLAGSYL